MVFKGGEMGEGAKQSKETSKLLLENLFKTFSDCCHMEIQGLFCLGLYTLTEFVLNTVRTLLPLTPALNFPLRITPELCC